MTRALVALLLVLAPLPVAAATRVSREVALGLQAYEAEARIAEPAAAA